MYLNGSLINKCTTWRASPFQIASRKWRSSATLGEGASRVDGGEFHQPRYLGGQDGRWPDWTFFCFGDQRFLPQSKKDNIRISIFKGPRNQQLPIFLFLTSQKTNFTWSFERPKKMVLPWKAIAPQKWWLEDYLPFKMVPLQGLCETSGV